MKTDLKILQKSINVDQERMMNCLILVFVENGIIKGTSIVQLLSGLTSGHKYRYYPPCLN